MKYNRPKEVDNNVSLGRSCEYRDDGLSRWLLPGIPTSGRIVSLRDLLSGSGQSGVVVGGDTLFGLSTAFWRQLLDAERELWYLAIATMFLDVTLTLLGLQLGLEEMNPIARRALDTVGAPGLYGIKMGALGVGVCARQLIFKGFTAIIPLALVIPTLVAVSINSVLIATIVL